MTVFAAIRGLTFLARDVFEAALYLIPAPGLSGYDVDDADLLAEREARVDVTEPWGECDCDCGLGPAPQEDDEPEHLIGVNDVARVYALSQQWMNPQTADSQRLDRITALLEDIRNLLQHNTSAAPAAGEDRPASGLSDAVEDSLSWSDSLAGNSGISTEAGRLHLDAIEALLKRGDTTSSVDIDRASTVENREWLKGYRAGVRWALSLVRRLETPPPPHAPVASASSPTPADATGHDNSITVVTSADIDDAGPEFHQQVARHRITEYLSDPTLANDPQSVHQRHMRRLLGEDK